MTVDTTKNDTVKTIISSPEFQELVAARKRLAIGVVTAIISAYFGFILLVAFRPDILGRPVGEGIISIGIYAGMAILLFGFVLAAIYMRISNGKIAELQQKIQQRFQ